MKPARDYTLGELETLFQIRGDIYSQAWIQNILLEMERVQSEIKGYRVQQERETMQRERPKPRERKEVIPYFVMPPGATE